MSAWRHGSLELCWYLSNEPTVVARGLVWSNNPIYCAASVLITTDFMNINKSGLHGLSDEEFRSLWLYLEKAHPGLKGF